jgi:hypothetical protein
MAVPQGAIVRTIYFIRHAKVDTASVEADTFTPEGLAWINSKLSAILGKFKITGRVFYNSKEGVKRCYNTIAQ